MNFIIRCLQALVFLALLPLSSCVDPFDPKVKNIPESFIVVDGYINSQGITTIKLSRTVNLTTDTIPPAESRATVYIEAEAGPPYILMEQQPGTYTSDNLSLDPLNKYRLHFTTVAGKEYISDFVPVKITPPIDNITWQPKDNGLQIYVSSQDASNSTQYYRWKYEETWEFNSAYQTSYEYKNKEVISRSDNIYVCWNTILSSAIKIGTTARLDQDVIADYPLVTLPRNSVKLGRGYSILVKQYALSQVEYGYYETLRKNTENIGTLFDPLPTQLTGNIHCLTNVSEPVIGFVGAHSETQKRIFIRNAELPEAWYQFSSDYANCPKPDTVLIKDLEFNFSSGLNLPISPIIPPGSPAIIGYTSSSISCVDCRLRGTNVKPDFWK